MYKLKKKKKKTFFVARIQIERIASGIERAEHPEGLRVLPDSKGDGVGCDRLAEQDRERVIVKVETVLKAGPRRRGRSKGKVHVVHLEGVHKTERLDDHRRNHRKDCRAASEDIDRVVPRGFSLLNQIDLNTGIPPRAASHRSIVSKRLNRGLVDTVAHRAEDVGPRICSRGVVHGHIRSERKVLRRWGRAADDDDSVPVHRARVRECVS